MSLPTRERGLKSCVAAGENPHTVVAPYTGAWIEILKARIEKAHEQVAPYTGAWIEIIGL